MVSEGKINIYVCNKHAWGVDESLTIGAYPQRCMETEKGEVHLSSISSSADRLCCVRQGRHSPKYYGSLLHICQFVLGPRGRGMSLLL